MGRNLFLILLALWMSVGAAAADQLSGPSRRTLMVSRWGIVFCKAKAKVHEPKGTQDISVATPSGPIQIVPRGNVLFIQYPDQTLVLRCRKADGVTHLLIQFDRKNYRIVEKPWEYQWHFPGENAYFQYYDGHLSRVVGSRGMLRVSILPNQGLYDVSSETGRSTYRIVTSAHGPAIKTVKGDPPDSHTYLTRGVIFQEGPVGLFVPLRGGRLVSALNWSTARRFTSALPAPKQTAIAKFAPPRSPLDAKPAGWNSSKVLNATMVPAGKDPLNLTLKPSRPASKPGKNPLNAVTAPHSGKLLNAKGYDQAH